jgi:hypothetical protein
VLPIGRVLLAARHIYAATAVMLTAYDYSTLLLEENLHSICIISAESGLHQIFFIIFIL